jgi:CRISPR/Cas system-associated exonuclease Cas4 (RecB family)
MLTVDRHNPYIAGGNQRHRRLTYGKSMLPLDDYGKADYTTGHQSVLVVHDVTRSASPDPAKIAQINLYLHAVHEIYGLVGKGILHTSDGSTTEVSYDRDAAMTDLKDLEMLLNSPAPAPMRIPICSGCTNYNWCFS